VVEKPEEVLSTPWISSSEKVLHELSKVPRENSASSARWFRPPYPYPPLKVHVGSPLGGIYPASEVRVDFRRVSERRSLIICSSVNSRFWEQRRRLAQKLQNPRLLQIKFHTLRHWKATTEYHRTKDILYVKQLLGHKSITNTILYTQLISFESDEYSSAVAKTLDEVRKLVEAGFEYVTDVDASKLFRKRK